MATLEHLAPCRRRALCRAQPHALAGDRHRRGAGWSPARCRSCFSNYHLFQLTQVLVYAIAMLGLNILTGYQRPDLARPRRLLRDRRLHHGDPDRQVRRALLGDDAGGGRDLPRRRLPLRPAGAAARGPLSRAHHLRARGRDAADAQIQGAGTIGPAACRASSSTSPTRRSACRSTATSGSICSPWRTVRAVRRRLEPGARAHRPRDDGDPRPSAGGRGDGHRHRAVQDADLRVSAPCSPASPARWARSWCSSSRPTASPSSCSISFLVGLVVGGVASISGALFGAIFIEFVPNFADQISKAAPGRSTA